MKNKNTCIHTCKLLVNKDNNLNKAHQTSEKMESGEDHRRERQKKEWLEKKLAWKKRQQMKSSSLNDNRNISWRVRTRNGTSEMVLISDTETEATKDHSTTDGQHQERSQKRGMKQRAVLMRSQTSE